MGQAVLLVLRTTHDHAPEAHSQVHVVTGGSASGSEQGMPVYASKHAEPLQLPEGSALGSM
jgi:hypothetical protein